MLGGARPGAGDLVTGSMSEQTLQPLPGLLGRLLAHLLGVGLGLLLPRRRGLLGAGAARAPQRTTEQAAG